MRYAMDGSGFTILNETPCTDLHAGLSWSNGTGCPHTLGMLSFGNMGRVTSMGPNADCWTWACFQSQNVRSHMSQYK